MSNSGRMAALLVVLVPLALGCASNTGQQHVDAASTELGRFRAELINAQKQIVQVDNMLAAVSKSRGEELQRAYAAYKDSTSTLTKQAARVRNRGDAMHASGDKYFANWEKDAQTIANTAVKDASLQRRTVLLASYGKLSGAMDATGAAYRPYESSLSDIQTYLDNDLTPAGLGVIKGEVLEAKQQGRAVHARIQKVLDATAEVERALSPGAS